MSEPSMTYRVGPKALKVIRAYMLFVIVICISGVALSVPAVIHNYRLFMARMIIAALMIGGVLALMIGYRRSYVILLPDAIEVGNMWRPRRRVLRSEITGRFTLPMYRGGRYHVMVLRGGKLLKLPPFLTEDAYFHDWMRDIPHT